MHIRVLQRRSRQDRKIAKPSGSWDPRCTVVQTARGLAFVGRERPRCHGHRDGIRKNSVAWPRFRGLHRGASMGTKAKQYTRAFAARAVQHCEASDKPIAEVARDLNVEYATLYGW